MQFLPGVVKRLGVQAASMVFNSARGAPATGTRQSPKEIKPFSLLSPLPMGWGATKKAAPERFADFAQHLSAQSRQRSARSQRPDLCWVKVHKLHMGFVYCVHLAV